MVNKKEPDFSNMCANEDQARKAHGFHPSPAKKEYFKMAKRKTYLHDDFDTHYDILGNVYNDAKRAHDKAEELRMAGKGSHDPVYKDSKKNK